MGSPDYEEGRDSDEGEHEVRISEGFWMKKYEVTRAEWEGVMGEESVSFLGLRLAVPGRTGLVVRHRKFIQRLNERESGSGNRYRLPTEAEWEYAARAETTGPRYGELNSIAWYGANSGIESHPIGQKRANAWGLHDMLGNVWEWTGDWYGEYPSGLVTDPKGPGWGSARVYRGGSWHSIAGHVRSADRYSASPGERFTNVGFRLVRTE